MDYINPSNDDLDALKQAPKREDSAPAGWVEKRGHKQINCDALSDLDGETLSFHVYIRQSLSDPVAFSCGIALKRKGRNPLTLARYNGANHSHYHIKFKNHIHTATAEAIARGKKPEIEAESTDRYSDLRGAFDCLASDYRLPDSFRLPPETGALI